jgi:two-component system, cell cycle sensor histidine kinase and response regulator CckA
MEINNVIRLLAIDDKPDNLTTLSAVVKEALPGTVILTAENGPDGIELAVAQDPDVILLDIVMPGMDGFEVCRRLKADARLKDIPVIFLTALKTDGAGRVKALEAGAEGFLAKPLEPAELTAQIRAMTKVKAANRLQQSEMERLEALVTERTAELRGALASLGTNEALHSKMIANIGDVIVIIDQNGINRYKSPNIEKLFGWKPEDVVGCSAFDNVHPDDVERGQTFVGALALTPNGFDTTEIRYRCKGGSYKWIEITIVNLLHDSSINGFLGNYHDITDRKQAEEELKRRELTLNKIFDVLPIGLWFADKNGKLIKGNPAGVEIWGAEPTVPMEEYGVFKARRLPSGEEIAPDDWALTHTIKKGVTITDELLEIEAFDGRRKIILNYTAPVIDDAGEMLGAIVVNNDITSRWQAEKNLRESEEKYRRIAENISDVVWIMGLDMRLSYVSPSVEKMVGESVAAHMNRTLEERLTPESMEKIFAVFTEEFEKENDPFVDKNRSREIEVEHYRADGSRFWVSVNASFLRDGNGNPIGIQGVTRDITERKRAEEEQRKLQAQLVQAQKMESVGRLAGGVAHDFNNMLSVILGHAELALEELAPDHSVYADLKEIDSAGRRSAGLVRQLLAFARKQTIAPIVLDLNETVESMLKMLRRLIGENIDLAWQPGQQLWPVRMDPSQIDQILANLCVNARDAIDQTGRISIEVRNVTIDQKHLDRYYYFVPGDYVLLAVTDDGCGMDTETLSHLFEPFFTTKEVGKGTGLGLATIYGIVKQNHGFITADSAPGRGTTFKIYLPRHAAAAATDQERRSSVPHARGHETVLLVEDEPSILKMGKTFLERLGYQVLTAAAPEDAIRLAREHAGEIHLLMTDVIMPEMNGRDLAVHVAAIYPQIKCLFMSGYTADIIAGHGVLEEGVHFVQKPFSRGELAVKVREALLE